jgi:hypothetical protein
MRDYNGELLRATDEAIMRTRASISRLRLIKEITRQAVIASRKSMTECLKLARSLNAEYH